MLTININMQNGDLFATRTCTYNCTCAFTAHLAAPAFARHRLARVPYIGVPRHSVIQRREVPRREAAALDSAAPARPTPCHRASSPSRRQAQGPGAWVGE